MANEQGRHEEALTLYHNVLRIRRLKLTAGHPDVAHAFIALGNVHRSKQEYQKSVQCYIEGLKIQKSSFGNDDMVVANTLQNISSIYQHD